MRKNILASLSDMGCFGSLVLSVQDIECYMNIFLIAISILILSINFVLRIYDRMKDGDLTSEEIEETIQDAKDTANEIKKKIKK